MKMLPSRDTAWVRLRDALGWRIHSLIGDRAVFEIQVQSAMVWRRLLKNLTFVGVTGSAGKTTTKELLVGMLSTKGCGGGTRGSLSNTDNLAKEMLRRRPNHRFFVAEVSEDHPGAMDRPLELLQPSIGIVTTIGNDHWTAFQSREAIAAEAAKLVKCLPVTGTAILNADDDLVLAMAANCAGNVITYGLSPQADLRAEDVRAVWPDRLQLTVVRGSERVPVHTQLCGTHWIPSVLGAIGGGIAAGMTLDECAQSIATVPPYHGRMQPFTTPDGVTFIRDDFKAPLWTIDSCFGFMKEGRAKRKILVVGTISDTHTGGGISQGDKYRRLARKALEIADIAIFVGPWAPSVLKARKPGDGDALRAFSQVRDAADYLNSITRDGDLVLLKGTNKQDHLFRAILARTADIACWRDDCKHDWFCNECSERTIPSGAPALPANRNAAVVATQAVPSGRRAMDGGKQVIVGLGNPEARYAGTPHNVGYEVVDRIADSMGLAWEAYPDAWIARTPTTGQHVCLIKMRVAMNLTGGALKQLAETMPFDPEQCILVHDDLALPLGSIRTRLSGGAGGHRGVASILDAFQTAAFRRVKIGVGHPGAQLNRVEYVLTNFAESDRPAVDQAISDAVGRALQWITVRPNRTQDEPVVSSH